MADSPRSYRLLQREGKELRRNRKHIRESSLLDQPPQSSDDTPETMWDTSMWNATGTSMDSEPRAGPDNITDHHCKGNADAGSSGASNHYKVRPNCKTPCSIKLVTFSSIPCVHIVYIVEVHHRTQNGIATTVYYVVLSVSEIIQRRREPSAVCNE
jgi:hypothetical protein